MSDQNLEVHKRTKSNVALALLHRDKSRHEKPPSINTTGSESGNGLEAEPSGSPSSMLGKRSPARLIKRSLSRSRSSATEPTAAASTDTVNSGPSDEAAVNPDITRVISSQSKGASIEQSVRTFRLFEALRSGDTAAILKALKSTSASSAAGHERRKSDASSSSLTGATGPLEGTTILHLAIQCAEQPVVEYILSTAKTTPGIDLDVNARDRDGNTPLHLTASLGRTDLVRLLLEQENINDSLPNYQGRFPIDLSKTPEIYQQLQLARSLFLENKVKELQKLVATRDYDNLESLLGEPRVEMLLDMNGTELAVEPVTTQTGGTLLHEAARHKDIRLIELLLLNGADPFRRDHKGKLPQDVTKDDKTRAMLKRSPAAAAAQRGIQEKAILGGPNNSIPFVSVPGATGDNVLVSKAGREMKGYLKKWTNYTSGYKMRWFVLEDGVLSYYKHQDDAGSACRGAINMRIAKLFMDAQDKQKFEILGKSSVKYHLKANHEIEAKRWYWALNNAIQWAKDEAKAEDKKKKEKSSAMLSQTKLDQPGKSVRVSHDGGPESSPASASGRRDTSNSRYLAPGSHLAGGTSTGQGSVIDEEGAAEGYAPLEPSTSGQGLTRPTSHSHTANTEGDFDDEAEYPDDASALEVQPAAKDAFNITAHSAKLQLDLLQQVSGALQAEAIKNPELKLADARVGQALASYDTAVQSLKVLLGDLLKIAKDRDRYWQYRLDREADVRKMWEDSMTRVAEEQEALESRMGESEQKRKRTKRALREALENNDSSAQASVGRSRGGSKGHIQISEALEKVEVDQAGQAPLLRRKSSAYETGRRKSAIAELAEISDTDSDDDEEFFDAIGTGDVEVVGEMPNSIASLPPKAEETKQEKSLRESKKVEIEPSYLGYEDPPRARLKLDADNRPKVGLWGILKSMIGKDMTKMTLPVSFNEPTNLLFRVAEDMEYTDLLDTAADRVDPTERLVYVATFAASGYASTIGRVAKPFNPLLGETYEYVRPDKELRFLMEQVSHHPPIGAAYAESPRWDYFGESAVKSKFYGKSFEFNPLGTWFLRLRPVAGGAEELYTWKKVTSSVVGIITNNPTVDNYGPMEVRNHTTGEVCTLDFKARGWKASSAYQVQGKILSADGATTKWSIGGHWNDKIYARPGTEAPSTPPPGSGAASPTSSSQAILVWQAHARPTGIPFNLTPFAVTLNALPEKLKPRLPPTDTRLRPDQRAMEDGEYDFAATEKNRVEEKQRAKRREREGKGEEFVPRWFKKGTCDTTGEEYWTFDGGYWRERERAAKEGTEWTNVEDIF